MAKVYELTQIAKLIGVDGQTIAQFVQKEWIKPTSENHFDDEDVARTRLILDLIETLGVNDEAVPIILHLVDQLYCLHSEIKNF